MKVHNYKLCARKRRVVLCLVTANYFAALHFVGKRGTL